MVPIDRFTVVDTWQEGAKDGGEMTWAELSFKRGAVIFCTGGRASMAERRDVDLNAYVDDVAEVAHCLASGLTVIEPLHDTFYGMREFRRPRTSTDSGSPSASMRSRQERDSPRNNRGRGASSRLPRALLAGRGPRARARRPGSTSSRTEWEKAAAYDTFIAGAGTYTFDGRTLLLQADLRKNPNEMTGDVWRWMADTRGDTLRLVFANPPFLPGREWRTTLVRIE